MFESGQAIIGYKNGPFTPHNSKCWRSPSDILSVIEWKVAFLVKSVDMKQFRLIKYLIFCYCPKTKEQLQNNGRLTWPRPLGCQSYISLATLILVFFVIMYIYIFPLFIVFHIRVCIYIYCIYDITSVYCVRFYWWKGRMKNVLVKNCTLVFYLVTFKM